MGERFDHESDHESVGFSASASRRSRSRCRSRAFGDSVEGDVDVSRRVVLGSFGVGGEIEGGVAPQRVEEGASERGGGEESVDVRSRDSPAWRESAFGGDVVGRLGLSVEGGDAQKGSSGRLAVDSSESHFVAAEEFSSVAVAGDDANHALVGDEFGVEIEESESVVLVGDARSRFREDRRFVVRAFGVLRRFRGFVLRVAHAP